MSDPTVAQPEYHEPTREQMNSALFAQLVMQQSNMALMLMGKTPHPETGETMKEPEAARMFIEMLEMLEVKTRGNLSKEESSLLKNALMATRMAFVESANAPAAAPAAQKIPEAGAPKAGEAPPEVDAADEEHKKKFTKKY
jgi:hypothetical protein